ncbi:MAG: hypothetical protein WC358_08575 [Ignavibacteria bacterium]|jgi:hypothetical protein
MIAKLNELIAKYENERKYFRAEIKMNDDLAAKASAIEGANVCNCIIEDLNRLKQEIEE